MTTDTPPPKLWTVLLNVALVWAAFMTFSLLQAGVPAVNETHYLAKARHLWRPDWCAGDLFLRSSNPHLVFYRTVGWLAAAFDFRTAAVAGRAVCLLVLAWGWVRLTTAVTHRLLAPAMSAAGFLLLSAMGNWSGEWVVGGVESKVPAYGFALAAAGFLIDGRLWPAALLLGLSVSFHPVVGLWFVMAMAAAEAWAVWSSDVRETRPLREWAVAAVVFVAASLPGMIPALSLLGQGGPELSTEAARYQVTGRLSHHLNPAEFPLSAYRGFLLTVVLAGVLAVRAGRGGRWLATAAAASLVFAAVGVAVGLTGDLETSDWRVSLLKFYPFRLADALVPMTACVLLAAAISCRWRAGVAAASMTAAALLIPAADRDSSRMFPDVRADWVEALEWIDANTPPEAVLLSADSQWAVKWFAQRAEYANYKDCPQDPPSMAAWRRRRAVMYRWSRDALADGTVTADELASFAADTGITHFITGDRWPVETEPAFSNGSFRVYALPSGEEDATPAE